MSLEQPRMLNKHFAEDADPKTIHNIPDVPDPNDIAQRPSLASYSTGFPPRSMAPPQAGGQPFYGQDVNGILKDVSANVQYIQAGNYYPFNANFQKAVGGYNKFAVVLNTEDDKLYQSLVDNNTAPLSDTKSWFFFTDGKYLSLTGGTVTGDTNFTAKLQNKGSDVTTIDQFDSKKENNGYQKFPGGLIMQWGRVDYDSLPAETDVTIAFPIAYPNACLNAQASRIVLSNSAAGNLDDGGVLICSYSKTNLTVKLAIFNERSYDVRGFTWFTVGI